MAMQQDSRAGNGFQQRSSSFVHHNGAFQEAGAYLSIGDEISQHDFEDDVLVAAVFSESEIGRNRIMYERDFRGGVDSSMRDGALPSTEVFSDMINTTDTAPHPDVHSSNRGRKNRKKPKTSSIMKVKKIDLTSMLDRCGGDLDLLNSVLDR